MMDVYKLAYQTWMLRSVFWSSTSTWTVDVLPLEAAMISGVRPSKSARFGLAPSWSNTVATSALLLQRVKVMTQLLFFCFVFFLHTSMHRNAKVSVHQCSVCVGGGEGREGGIKICRLGWI